MNVCDICEEMGTVNCNHCWWGNPCLGCQDYLESADECKSHGGCGTKEASVLEGPEEERKALG